MAKRIIEEGVSPAHLWPGKVLTSINEPCSAGKKDNRRNYWPGIDL